MALRKGKAGLLVFRVVLKSTSAPNDLNSVGDDFNRLLHTAGVNNLVDANFIKKLSKDGAAAVTATNSVQEVTPGSNRGLYFIQLTTSETDCDVLAFKPLSDADANFRISDPPIIIEYTDPDWETKVLGASFVAGTDSLRGIKSAITNALTPIQRDD